MTVELEVHVIGPHIFKKIIAWGLLLVPQIINILS